MEEYKIISDSNNIILKKKENKFKLQFATKVKKNCNIIEIIKENKLYELLYLLNKDIVEEYKCKKISDKEDEIVFIMNKLDEDDDGTEKNYISINNSIIVEKNKAYIIGKKNNYISKKEDYKKFDVDNFNLKFHLKDEILELEMSFYYVGNKIPKFIEDLMGRFFKKILHRLKLYLE